MQHDTGLDYWKKFDHNEATDESIFPLMNKALDIKAVYFRDSPLLLELDKKSFAAHRKKLDNILAKPWAKRFVSDLMQVINSNAHQDQEKSA